MIEVDVVVPSLNKKYDFALNEHTAVANIIEELSEMICRNERCVVVHESGFELCCPRKAIICDPAASLSDYSIGNGELIMLI